MLKSFMVLAIAICISTSASAQLKAIKETLSAGNFNIIGYPTSDDLLYAQTQHAQAIGMGINEDDVFLNTGRWPVAPSMHQADIIVKAVAVDKPVKFEFESLEVTKGGYRVTAESELHLTIFNQKSNKEILNKKEKVQANLVFQEENWNIDHYEKFMAEPKNAERLTTEVQLKLWENISKMLKEMKKGVDVHTYTFQIPGMPEKKVEKDFPELAESFGIIKSFKEKPVSLDKLSTLEMEGIRNSLASINMVVQEYNPGGKNKRLDDDTHALLQQNMALLNVLLRNYDDASKGFALASRTGGVFSISKDFAQQSLDQIKLVRLDYLREQGKEADGETLWRDNHEILLRDNFFKGGGTVYYKNGENTDDSSLVYAWMDKKLKGAHDYDLSELDYVIFSEVPVKLYPMLIGKGKYHLMARINPEEQAIGLFATKGSVGVNITAEVARFVQAPVSEEVVPIEGLGAITKKLLKEQITECEWLRGIIDAKDKAYLVGPMTNNELKYDIWKNMAEGYHENCGGN